MTTIPMYDDIKGTDYSGPVLLTAAQKARTQARADRWTQTVIAQARDASDPETQRNAQILLTSRGIGW